jgi:hypothetical protein
MGNVVVVDEVVVEADEVEVVVEVEEVAGVEVDEAGSGIEVWVACYVQSNPAPRIIPKYNPSLPRRAPVPLHT